MIRGKEKKGLSVCEVSRKVGRELALYQDETLEPCDAELTH